MCVLLGAIARAQDTETLPSGMLMERVVCAADEARSYALYLPSGYTRERAWPVLYVFDPGARGAFAAARFQEGAERFGWIVAASNDCRNGPLEPSVAAANAMFRDSQARLHMDRRRIYVAGFSGGGGVAIGLGGAMPVAGLIISGTNTPDDFRLQIRGAVLYGAAGVDDFNIHPTRRIVCDYQASGGAARFSAFDGSHEWLTPPVATDAILWMEIQAMRTGLRDRDTSLIEATFAQWGIGAARLPPGERLYELRALAGGFDGLMDVAPLRAEVAELDHHREARTWERRERAAAGRLRQDCSDLMELASRGGFSDVESEIADLRKQADTTTDSEGRRHARRVLQATFVGGFESGRQAMDGRRFRDALAMFRLATIAEPERAGAFFELARASALAGSPRDAIAALKQAASLGLDVAGRVEGDSDFDSLLRHAAFRTLVESSAARRPE